ncbi:hypothetical protein ACH7BS_24600 [Klebsiella aerogenes]|uniref:hypothetical protein n=1 Tax=Klebsiella aerogenes TaxID=548 RepID=UPI0037B13F9C
MKAGMNMVIFISIIALSSGCTSDKQDVFEKKTPTLSTSVAVPSEQATHHGTETDKPVIPSSATLPQHTRKDALDTSGKLPIKTKVYEYNWEVAFGKTVKKIKAANGFTSDDILFVGRFRNNTNGDIDIKKGREYLMAAIEKNDLFSLITSGISQSVRQQLGLNDKDMISTPGKVLAIARKCGAKFALFTSLKGKRTAPSATIKIIGVQDGFIYFEDKTTLKATITTVIKK